MPGDALHDTEPITPEDLALVERLWRSGTSTTAVSPSTRRDLHLLQRFLTTGDGAVVAPLLRRHLAATWRLAAVVTLDAEAAATAVEAAWQEVLDGHDGVLDGRVGVRSWLFGITRRMAVEAGTAAVGGIDLDRDGTGLTIDQTGDVGVVASAFAMLDEVARTAVWLHTVEGLDDVDIAHVLGLDRLETHELIDAAMGDLRVGAARGQLADAGERCQGSVRSFLPYLDEDLDRGDETQMIQHMAGCRRCAARLDALEAPGLTLVDRVLAPPATVTERIASRAAPVAAG